MENNSHIQYCVTYTTKKEKHTADGSITIYEDQVENFENIEDGQKRYKEVLELKGLYTANFCKVLDTTG